MAICLFLLTGPLLPGLSLAEAGEDPLPYTLFKSLISSADGNRCSHVPSCARYAKEAIAAQGPVKGFVLSCDRLIRCGGDDRSRLPQVVVDGKRYAWDPVSANDFRWGKEEPTKSIGRRVALPMRFEGWE